MSQVWQKRAGLSQCYFVPTPKERTQPTVTAIGISVGILVVAFIVAFLLRDKDAVVPISVPANQGFGLFAVFYVAAQVVERLTEPLTWALDRLKLTENANKPNRIAVIHSIVALIAVIISSFAGLHFLQAVGIGNEKNHLPWGFDSFATGLLISGGTKPLHDFISYLQQNKPA